MHLFVFGQAVNKSKSKVTLLEAHLGAAKMVLLLKENVPTAIWLTVWSKTYSIHPSSICRKFHVEGAKAFAGMIIRWYGDPLHLEAQIVPSLPTAVCSDYWRFASYRYGQAGATAFHVLIAGEALGLIAAHRNRWHDG